MTTQFKRAVGLFETYSQTEKALTVLQQAGFDMDKVSVVARNSDQSEVDSTVQTHEEAVGNQADKGATAGATTGGILGGLTGLLVGLGAISIPGIGPILLAGAEATAIATTLAGTAIGAAAGGLVGSLVGLGIPEEHAQMYSDRVAQGHYLMIISGSADLIHQAERILSGCNIQAWQVYDVPTPYQKETTAEATVVTEEPDVVIVDRRDEAYR